MQNCIVRGGYIVKQNVSTHDISIQRIIQYFRIINEITNYKFTDFEERKKENYKRVRHYL